MSSNLTAATLYHILYPTSNFYALNNKDVIKWNEKALRLNNYLKKEENNATKCITNSF